MSGSPNHDEAGAAEEPESSAAAASIANISNKEAKGGKGNRKRPIHPSLSPAHTHTKDWYRDDAEEVGTAENTRTDADLSSSLAKKMVELGHEKSVPEGYTVGPAAIPKGKVEVKVGDSELFTIHRPIGTIIGSVRPDWVISYTREITSLEEEAALAASVRSPVSVKDIETAAHKLGLLVVADGIAKYKDGRNRADALAEASAKVAAVSKVEEKEFSDALSTWNNLPKGKGIPVPKKPKRTAMKPQTIDYLLPKEIAVERKIKEMTKIMRQSQPYPAVGEVRETSATYESGRASQIPAGSLKGVPQDALASAIRRTMYDAFVGK